MLQGLPHKRQEGYLPGRKPVPGAYLQLSTLRRRATSNGEAILVGGLFTMVETYDGGIAMKARKDRPLIYACSGCSDVAQLANNVAVRLDHTGEFEMSCISGVGGQVPALVNTARSGRSITVIDGCPLQCARACLTNVGVEPDDHIRLYEFGFRKHYGRSYDAIAVDEVCHLVRERHWQCIPVRSGR